MNAAKSLRCILVFVIGILLLTLCAGTAAAQTPYETALKNLHFRAVGPAVMGGRVDDIAAVESDPRIFYVGAAAGGLLKTVNGGMTWVSLFDNESNPSIGDIAIAPSNPSIVYVGTGEANNRQSSSWGDGVFKSVDGGNTWQHLGLKETHHIGRIVVDPSDPNKVWVAALGDLWGPNKERGVYRSIDGGASWSQTLFINEDTGVSDIAIDPQSPNILYAAAYQRRRTVFGYNGGGPSGGLYRSTDGGAHWTKLTRGLPTTGDVGRFAVEVYRRNPNIVYALVEHATLGGVYRSEDKGMTWARMSDTNPRPSYFSQLRIDPNNDQKLWLGGVNIYLSEDGGKTFVQTRFQGVHSDVHGIWINPADSDNLIIGCDGGVWTTSDSGRHWRHINNFPLGQFYEVSFDFQKPYHICGGAQDNYSWCGPSSTTQQLGIGNEDWITVAGGDGFYNRIDQTEPNIVYAESQDGSLSRRDLKTSESKSIRPQEENDNPPRYRFQWNSPLMISAHDHKTIYYGGNHLFKSTDRGDNWVRLGEDLTNNADRDKMEIMGKAVDRNTLSRHDGVVAWPCLTVIAESPLKAGVLWVGTDDGNVQVSRDDGKTWSNVAANFPGLKKGAYVSRIDPSRTGEGTAYVAFDNHRSADYAIYIYVTKDFGKTFTRITNGIPVEAGTVHAVREDPANTNLLFAGTEFGLYFSLDRGGAWHKMKNGLATVPVFDIQIQPREHDLILATHGRSFQIMDNISALENLSDDVLKADLKAFPAHPTIEYKMANYRSFMGGASFLAPNAPAGAIVDYYAKSAGPVQVTVKDKAGNDVRKLTARAEAGVVNRVVWDMRYDSPIPPAAAGAGGGRGGAGRGGAGGGGRGGAAEAAPRAGEQGANMEEGGAPGGGGGGGGGGGRGGFGAGRGSLVDPGEYTVTLTMAGKSDTVTVTVEEDPRVELAAADRTKRREAITTLTALVKEADQARREVTAMNTALTNLVESWNQPAAPAVPEAIKKAVTDLRDKLKPVIATFQGPAGGGGRGGGGGGAGPPLQYNPPTVSAKLQRLLGSIDGFSGPPTTTQLADIEKCSAQLKAGLPEVAKLSEEVPKLNKQMQDAGVPYFKVDVNAVGAPTGGFGPPEDR